MPGILWLASFPKSGNTWMRAFLGNFIFDAPEPLSIARLQDFTIKDNFLFHYEEYTGRSRTELTDAEIWRLRPEVHAWFARSAADNVMVKTHSAIATSIFGVPAITPAVTAGAIYVLRNPLDVAVSFAHHIQVDYAQAVEFICHPDFVLPPMLGQIEQYLGSWSNHVRSWTRAPAWPLHVVRYEDLLTDPQGAFGGVARFLNLPDDPARLDKAIRFSDFGELAGQEARDGFNEARPDGAARFFRQGRIGAWREVLSGDQMRQIVDSQRETMTEFGYLSDAGELLV